MIRLSDIFLSFKGKVILRDLNWNIKSNRKYGLVGPNGAGKTSLLEVISGRLDPEKGDLSVSNKAVLGYLPQEINYSIRDSSVIEETLGVFTEGANSSEENPERLRYLAEKILAGLGFVPEQFDESADSMSGGWKMRIELAKILLNEPDVLLLDEPTNHLDIQSIEWIEDYLSSFKGTVVLVSHDKYLLDRMIDTVAALEKGTVREYHGNYTNYLVEKETIKKVQLSTFKNQQKKINQTERFIERFRYKNTKAKQVQSRIKMLEKIEVTEEPESEQRRIKLKFPEAQRSGRVVYDISTFSKEYKTLKGDKNVVFENSGPLEVERGDKIALAGKNGEGKTTLAKIITGLEKFNGKSKLGHNVHLAYYAQNQSDNLNLDKTVYDELLDAAPHFSDTQIRSTLGSFLFDEEDLEKRVKVLSGGEKSRVSLSKMLVSPSNFLVLDEPTNHLDIQSREILLEALKSYSGTFIIISHDRYFIDQLVNKVWYVENKNIVRHLGNYSEFLQKYKVKKEKIPEEQVVVSDQSSGGNDKKIKAELRNRLYRELKEKGIENMDNWKELTQKQLSNALPELEKRISEIESCKNEIEELMSHPDFFKDQIEAEKKSSDFDELDEKLKVLYKRWEEVTDYLNLE